VGANNTLFETARTGKCPSRCLQKWAGKFRWATSWKRRLTPTDKWLLFRRLR